MENITIYWAVFSKVHSTRCIFQNVFLESVFFVSELFESVFFKSAFFTSAFFKGVFLKVYFQKVFFFKVHYLKVHYFKLHFWKLALKDHNFQNIIYLTIFPCFWYSKSIFLRSCLMYISDIVICISLISGPSLKNSGPKFTGLISSLGQGHLFSKKCTIEWARGQLDAKARGK